MAGIVRCFMDRAGLRVRLPSSRSVAFHIQSHSLSKKSSKVIRPPRAAGGNSPPAVSPRTHSQHPPTSPPPPPPPRVPLLSPNIVVGTAIAACLGVSGYVNLKYGRDLKTNRFINDNFTMSQRNVEQGRWWVLMTSTFTHFSMLHLGLNMSALWSFGRETVLFFRPAGFVLLWVGGGVGGSLVTLYWSSIMNWAVKNKIVSKPYGVREHSASVGASGSICGMWGALIALMVRGGLQPRPFDLLFIGGSIYCIISGDLPQIGHITHLGGMAVGATLLPTLRKLARRGR